MTVVGIDSESVTGPRQVRQYGTINPNDVTVYAFYKDESRKAVSNKSIVDFDSSRVGPQTVTVRISGGFTASFQTEVMALTGITVVSPPEAVRFGTSTADITHGLNIQGAWDRMGSEKIDNARCQVTGHNPNNAGRQTVTVSYQGKTATFNVNVVQATSIRIASNPAKLTYNQGESLDLSGIRIAVVYPGLPDFEYTTVNLSDVSGYNSNTVGRQTVTVIHRNSGRTATFTVEVRESLYDPALNGTWVMRIVADEFVYKFNNGNWEYSMSAVINGQTFMQGTYTTSSGRITNTITHRYTGGQALGIPEKLYTRNELETALRAAGRTQEAIDAMQLGVATFPISTLPYSISGNTLTFTLEGGRLERYTKR
jgi:hypothetical protein